MEKKHLDIIIEKYKESELTGNDRILVDKAIRATRNSYSPYSHFSVGACVMLADGKTIIGANQENAAYPVGLCAERAAIFAAQSQYPETPIIAIAIAARDTSGELTHKPVTPCGSCRQVILEIEQRYSTNVRVLLYGTSHVYAVNSIKDLLPLSFIAEDMNPTKEEK